MTRVPDATHRPSRRVHALLDERLFDARLLALVAPRIAVAHGRPGKIDARAAARKEEVVLPSASGVGQPQPSLGARQGWGPGTHVDPIILARGPAVPEQTNRRALDGDDDGRVGRVGELARGGAGSATSTRSHTIPKRQNPPHGL